VGQESARPVCGAVLAPELLDEPPPDELLPEELPPEELPLEEAAPEELPLDTPPLEVLELLSCWSCWRKARHCCWKILPRRGLRPDHEPAYMDRWST
jgi:hypothetical protein